MRTLYLTLVIAALFAPTAPAAGEARLLRFPTIHGDSVAFAYAGNLYSVEFYELVRSRLAPGGLFVQWAPTDRSLNGVRRVFRHVALGEVPDYFASKFLVAGDRPVPLHAAAVGERFAAVDLGASRIVVFRRILLPYLKPSLLAATCIAFLQSFENYNTTLFVRGTETPLTVYIATKVRTGLTPAVNALGLLLIAATVLAAVAYELARRRQLSASRV